jgi:hypothetical protein
MTPGKPCCILLGGLDVPLKSSSSGAQKRTPNTPDAAVAWLGVPLVRRRPALSMQEDSAASQQLLHIDDFAVAGPVEVRQPRILGKAHALIETARARIAVG